jgi:hypothetical protein
MIKRTKEKRKYPRLETKLPLKLAANGYDFVTNTHNISCVGAYCNINKYLPPFTKIIIRLSLPNSDRKLSKQDCDVECKGVVVRTEDEAKGGFNIAIFFNEINNSQRKKLSQFINQILSK